MPISGHFLRRAVGINFAKILQVSGEPDPYEEYERAAQRAGRVFMIVAAVALAVLAVIVARSVAGASFR
jgi:hypothetical protein